MTSYRKNFLIMLLFSAVIMLCNLNVRELFSGDETRVAGIIAEMAVDGDMVTPKLNGKPFLEYPPLYYQAGSIFFNIFGFTDAAAKLPSAVCALGSALLVYLLGKKLKFSPDACLAAGVILLTSAQFFNNGRKCMVDMMLAFSVMLAVFAFYSMLQHKKLPGKIGFFLLYSLGLACGFFTKGLIGFAFPWAGLGIYLVMNDIMVEKKFSFFRYLWLGLGIVPVMIPVVYWAHRLFAAGGEKALNTVFIVNGIGRFSGSQGDHVESVWYYFEKLPGLFQPWLIFMIAGFVYAVIRLRNKTLSPGEILLPLCCAAAPFLMLLTSSAKRQVYLLPIYASWALIAGWFIIDCKDIILEKLKTVKFPVIKYLSRLLFAAGLVQLAVFIWLVPGWNKILFAAALAMLICAPFFAERRKLLLLTALAIGFTGIDAGYLALKNQKESLRPMFEACRRAEQEKFRVTLPDPVPERTSGAAVFYLHKRIPIVKADAPLAPDEVRIIRSRDVKTNGLPFADHHFLIKKTQKKQTFERK